MTALKTFDHYTQFFQSIKYPYKILKITIPQKI